MNHWVLEQFKQSMKHNYKLSALEPRAEPVEVTLEQSSILQSTTHFYICTHEQARRNIYSNTVVTV